MQSLCQPPSRLSGYLYDQPFNNSFHDRLKSIHYNSCLEIMGAISGTSRKKLYQELDLEHFRLWLWRMKFFKSEHPQYFFHLIPATFSSHTSSNLHSIPIFNIKQFFFKNSVFLSTISEWNKLHSGLCNSESLSTFRKNIL